MSYKCIECKYETHDQSNYQRHKKSKKHINNESKNVLMNPEGPRERPEETQLNYSVNIDNSNTCFFCNQSFKHKTHLYRHQKYRCVIRLNKDKEIEDLKLKNQQLNTKNEQLSSENKKLIDTNLNNSEVTKKSMNIMTYALKHFEGAPPIGLLEDDKFDKMVKCLVYDDDGEKKTDKSIEEIITFHYNKGTLVKVLGELILLLMNIKKVIQKSNQFGVPTYQD